MTARIVNVIIAIVMLLASGYTGYLAGTRSVTEKYEHELKICADEVSQGCPNVTTYAVMLENENARLNRECKRVK